MTKKEADEFLDLIVKRAPALRDAGVLRVELGGVAFTLAAAELEETHDQGGTGEEQTPTDVLRDSWTYGVPPRADGSSALPRRTRRGL